MAFEILMPQLGLTMEEGTVSQWIKHEGDEVKVGEVILEISTDKLTNEIVSENDGVLLKIVAQENEDVPVKGILGYIGQPGEGIQDEMVQESTTPTQKEVVASPSEEARVPASINNAEGKRVRISPLARKTADKLGVDYSSINGSGTSGRIVQKDIINAAELKTAITTPVSALASTSSLSPVGTSSVELMDGDELIKPSGMRKVVAQRMFQSHDEIPTVTQNIKVDVTELMKLREQLLEATGKKYSVNDLILKATAKTLSRHPEILVSYGDDYIIKRAHINLAMAVALDDGLIVPVIRDADRLGLEAISVAAKDLAARAKENKLSPDEYKGSTFTVTNIGMFGIESFTPIINQPDACILGVCAIQDELVMDEEGIILKRKVMRLSLTFDHRLLDGATAAKFIKDLRDVLQQPMNILL